jgi:tol-pal system protein YbgF
MSLPTRIPAVLRRALLLMFLASLACAPIAASAQDSQVRALMDRVERLQREVTDLQRTVYRGEAPPPGSVAPADGNAAQMLLRVQQLEDQLRQITGQLEELTYRQTQLEQKVDKINADTDLRLQQLEGGAAPLAAAPGPEGGAVSGGISPPDAGSAANPNAATAGATAPAAPSGGVATSPTPGVLGTISETQLSQTQAQAPDRTAAAAAAAAAAGGAPAGGAAAPTTAAPATGGTGAQVAALPPGELPAGSPEEQYQYAWGLLRGQDYPGAEAALRSFISQHPQHTLAGNAQYWLGETYYVRKDYRQAAVAFAEGYQNYPNSAKAPDNLLKLGLALAQIGEKGDACEAFAQLGRQFPTAPQSLKDRAQRERQRLACG